MARFKLILTCDYEVFGDGSGHVRKCMIEPSSKMMDICEKHGTRMTFFVDICEYWAFAEVEESGKFSKGYTPATWIRNQLREMVRRGHDVQLHMHPQWLDYKFVDDHTWRLNLDHWRLPEYAKKWPEAQRVSKLTELFSRGKAEFERILVEVDEEYTCSAFRAGAWCIQPESAILNAMRSAGLTRDTSVAPGIKRKDSLYEIDFSNVPPGSTEYFVGESVTERHSTSGQLIEVPIATSITSLFSRIKWTSQAISRKLNNNACGCTGQPAYKATSQGTFSRKVKRLLTEDIEMLDFCGRSTSDKMLGILYGFMKHATKREADLPVVAIGHPKNFGNEGEFDDFLRRTAQLQDVDLESLNAKPFWR